MGSGVKGVKGCGHTRSPIRWGRGKTLSCASARCSRRPARHMKHPGESQRGPRALNCWTTAYNCRGEQV
eukprot:656837-Prymnesium_polylepis.2